MIIDLETLVEKVNPARFIFSEASKGYYEEGRPFTVLQSNFSELVSENLAELMAINADLLKGSSRESGKPYFSHVLSSAYIAAELMDAAHITDQDIREKAIAYTLSHDFVYKACGYDKEAFESERIKFLPAWGDALNAAVLLAGANKHSGVARAAKITQVQNYGDKAHAIALLSDAVDNMLDLEYVADQGPSTQAYAAQERIARTLATMYAMRELTPELLIPVIGLCMQHASNFEIQLDWSPDVGANFLQYQVEAELRGLGMDTATGDARGYDHSQAIAEHFETYGFVKPLPARLVENMPSAQRFLREH